MKSQLVTALSVVGVIGTASAAFAANTETLASFDATQVEQTSSVVGNQQVGISPLNVEATPAPSTSADPTQPTPNGDNLVVTTDTQQVPDTAVAPAPAPAPAPADGTSAGSGTRVNPDDDHDEVHDEDHDEYEEDDD